MIVLALVHILPVNYLGGIVVALFITGVFYTWANTWRQTRKLIKEDSAEQKILEDEEVEMEREYPTALVHSLEEEQREKEKAEINERTQVAAVP